MSTLHSKEEAWVTNELIERYAPHVRSRRTPVPSITLVLGAGGADIIGLIKALDEKGLDGIRDEIVARKIIESALQRNRIQQTLTRQEIVSFTRDAYRDWEPEIIRILQDSRDAMFSPQRFPKPQHTRGSFRPKGR